MDYRKFFFKLRQRKQLVDRVILLLSSEDEGLRDYYNRSGCKGSTDMDENGMIYVKVHDAGDADRSTWYEEMGHALQFLRDGNVPMGSEAPEMAEREVEIADCLLSNPNRKRKLTEAELERCRKSRRLHSDMYDQS